MAAKTYRIQGLTITETDGESLEGLVTLSSLSDGDRFKFPGTPGVLECRGNNWYGTPGGYDGGPWHTDGARLVRPLATCHCCEQDKPLDGGREGQEWEPESGSWTIWVCADCLQKEQDEQERWRRVGLWPPY